MERFLCNICNAPFKKLQELESHINIHKRAILCITCNWVARGEDQLDDHVRQIHGPAPRPYVCPVKNCPLAFPEERLLVSHMTRFHPEVGMNK